MRCNFDLCVSLCVSVCVSVCGCKARPSKGGGTHLVAGVDDADAVLLAGDEDGADVAAHERKHKLHTAHHSERKRERENV